MQPSSSGERQAHSSLPEDRFVELFAQVIGLDKVQLLAPQFPVEDIYGNGRLIDYALRTLDDHVAFEIDSHIFHNPEAIPVEKFEDDLLRQNSLNHQGWQVFRWTDRELANEPERLKEELALFLERIPGLLSLDEFLPKQQGEVFELRPHQEGPLESLASKMGTGSLYSRCLSPFCI